MHTSEDSPTSTANVEAVAKYALVDYNKYFDNTVVDKTPLEQFSLGVLNVTSGRIIACDPLVGIYHTNPFTRTVAPGKYPVTVCVAKTEKQGERFALAKIEFSKERAVKWEMAVVAGQNIQELKAADEFFGFPVDSGLGCFCDVETKGFYNQFATQLYESNGPGFNIYNDFFAAEFKKNAINPSDPKDIGDWLNFHLPNQPELNIMMFVSGNGDGAYPCFWGITEQGEVCSLVIDFFVL